MRALRKKCPEIMENLVYHQDNAPAHSSQQTQATLASLGFEVLDHSPYSPDLAPCDFAMFKNLKENMQGEKYDNIEDLTNRVNSVHQEYAKDGLRHVYLKWVERHEKCVASHGKYFEKV